MSSNQPTVRMYTSRFCPFCMRADQLLAQHGVAQVERIYVDGQPEVKTQMIEETGRRTVPQIYIGSTHVGGCDDLIALDRAGKLDAMLSGQP